MKRIRLLTIVPALMVALATLAQQPSGPGGVQAHLKVLTEKLGLTDAQQIKAKPILQEMNDAVQKIMHNDTLSRKEQLDKIKPCHEKADKKLRKILNDDQKVKLDQLEHQAHPEMHGESNGPSQN